MNIILRQIITELVTRIVNFNMFHKVDIPRLKGKRDSGINWNSLEHFLLTSKNKDLQCIDPSLSDSIDRNNLKTNL